MHLAELNECLRRLAHLSAGGSPVLSAYLDSRRTREAQLFALNLHYYAARSVMPKAVKAASDEAFSAVLGYQKAAVLPPGGGLALFVRAGSSPLFYPLELTAPVEASVSLRVGPSIYRLAEMRDNYDQFILVELLSGQARLSVVELGGVTRQWTVEGQGMVLLRKAARRLEKWHGENSTRRWILAGPLAQSDAFCSLLAEDTVAQLIDDIGEDEDPLARAIQRFLAFEEAEDQALARLLPRQLKDRRLARAGWPSVRATLLEGAASRVFISAQTLPSDVREEAALLAERTGARLEVVGQSQELQSVGDVACLVRTWE